MVAESWARIGSLLLLAGGLIAASPASLESQDLEPRAFSPVPVGVNFAALGYGYSFGNVLLDPSIPVEDGTGKIHSLIGAYVRTFDFFGMSAKVDGVVPFAFGDWEGRLAGRDTSRVATGFGDPSVRLVVNFIGAPALGVPRFMTYRQGTIVGASLRVVAPFGQYDETKLLNLGTNRWTFIPRLGASRRLGRWTVEAVAAVYLFTENPDALGSRLQQDPLWTLQGDVSYTFEGGAWVALNAGWGSGARARVDGVESSTDQNNTRFSLTANYPLTRRASLKAAWTSGLSTRLGADFDSLVLVCQYRWGGGL